MSKIKKPSLEESLKFVKFEGEMAKAYEIFIWKEVEVKRDKNLTDFAPFGPEIIKSRKVVGYLVDEKEADNFLAKHEEYQKREVTFIRIEGILYELVKV